MPPRLPALYVTRVPRLVQNSRSHAPTAVHRRCSARLAKLDVLVLDDFLIAPMKDTERRDLLEVLEDRYDRSSTVITTQVPTKTWHEMLADPTIADAICDRLVHNAHVLALKRPLDAKEERTRDRVDRNPPPDHPLVASLRRDIPSLRSDGAQVSGTSAQVRRNECPGRAEYALRRSLLLPRSPDDSATIVFVSREGCGKDALCRGVSGRGVAQPQCNRFFYAGASARTVNVARAFP